MNAVVNEQMEFLDNDNFSDYLWIYISPVIVVFGLLGNVFNLFVFWNLDVWRRSVILCMGILSTTDIVILCSGLSRYWIRAVIDFDIRTLSNWGCKINLFVLYTAMQYSSWIRVFMMLVSTLSLKKVNVSKNIMIIILSVTLVVLAGINAHFFWTNGLVNGTTGTYCGSLTPEYEYFDEFIFVYIDLTVMAVLPFLVMLILSVVTMNQLQKLRSLNISNPSPEPNMTENDQSTSHPDKSLAQMLLFCTFYFLLATLPISIYFVVDSYKRPHADSITEVKLDLAWSICYIFQYTIYAANFYIFVLSTTYYRKRFKDLFICNSRNNDTETTNGITE